MDPYKYDFLKEVNSPNSVIARGFEYTNHFVTRFGANYKFNIAVDDSCISIDRGSLLFSALASMNVDICKMLIERGADVNKISPDGLTALTLASAVMLSPKGIDLVSMLIEAGADPFINVDGRTIYDTMNLETKKFVDSKLNYIKLTKNLGKDTENNIAVARKQKSI